MSLFYPQSVGMTRRNLLLDEAKALMDAARRDGLISLKPVEPPKRRKYRKRKTKQ